MERIRKILQDPRALVTLVLCGLAARLAAATLGHNYDMDSWYAVADIMRHGDNVYAATYRYNYGPVWFCILHGLDALAGHRHEVLRYLIAAFLSLVDLGIFFTLCRQAGRLAGALFFLNPVSILITGYHGQFDNLAVLLALWSARCFGDDFEKAIGRRQFCGLLWLGLSLATKHLFFLFPVWLAVKQKGRWQKFIILAVPAACFLASFAPFWPGGREGIESNVFGYPSAPTNHFYKFFVPQCIQFFCDSATVWYGILVLFAFVCRSRNSFESVLIYSGLLVAAAPATTNQYLAIPVALMAVFPSLPFAVYTAVSVVHILADVHNGPRVWAGFTGRYDDLAIYALCVAMAWLLWRSRFRELFAAAWREIANQLGMLK
jgi:hypothetical protein